MLVLVTLRRSVTWIKGIGRILLDLLARVKGFLYDLIAQVIGLVRRCDGVLWVGFFWMPIWVAVLH